MNTVSMIGRIVGQPDLRKNRTGEDECRMRLAVPRRQGNGQPDAGVVYLDVATFGPEARECAQLHEGASIGLWGVSVIGNDDGLEPQATWGKTLTTLVWERNDWRIDTVEAKDGPTASLAAGQEPSDADELLNRLSGLRSVRHSP